MDLGFSWRIPAILGVMLCGASAAAQTARSVFATETWWTGSYTCGANDADFLLRTKMTASGRIEGYFEPGGGKASAGAFLLIGFPPDRRGTLELTPTAWIHEAPGRAMLGLSGIVRGDTYTGHVSGDAACTNFQLRTVAARPVTGPRGEDEGAGQTVAQMRKKGGVWTVPVRVNDSLDVDFVIDSGASDVQVPADVVATLEKNGALLPSDFQGTRTFVMADGSTVPSRVFRIRTLKVGRISIDNVSGHVAARNAIPLLGQSFLGRLPHWSIDNGRNTLVIE